ncbi:MAG: hypothetical protein CL920_20010 [Deltaproteobacteria bacterium]|nr:hypothetical protein [Deltaproteobacteria bacterium]MBU50976.1 hypothetical protein [Deltaproteobacteria bacterium]|tara:strand:+ start:24076 stop:25926 length:1851 start_codon:yes stop_codon:yes gene_type:complete
MFDGMVIAFPIERIDGLGICDRSELMSVQRKSTFKWWVVGILGLWLCVVPGCGTPDICEDGYDEPLSNGTINPSGSICENDCECSNQVYWGRCLDSGEDGSSSGSKKCISFQRGTCQTPGQELSCLMPVEFGEACRDGVRKCQPDGLQSAVWGACKPRPSVEEKGVELCLDGFDNDCDGQIDSSDDGCQGICTPGEQRPCFSGKGKVNVGICAGGFQTCDKKGAWGTECEGEIIEEKELCNGKDDDCDGKIDNNLTPPSCGQGKQGSCAQAVKQCDGTKGWKACDITDYRVIFIEYEEKETLCDGLDNDCDGQIDNNLKAPLCTGKTGPCFGSVQRCGGSQGWLSCEATDFRKNFKKYQEKETLCDGFDNDCDGQVDNGLNAPPCGKGKGICFGSKKQCGGDKGWLDCTSRDYLLHNIAYEATETKCDKLDNDCNGLVDEKCLCQAGSTRACGSNEGECKQGFQTCTASATWGPCIGPVGPTTEECNNLDDDCNGKIDDNLTRSCYTGPSGTDGVGICTGGTQVCAAGQWGTCQNETKPATKETCNKKDDDCDGKVDNSITDCQAGTACVSGKCTTCRQPSSCRLSKCTCGYKCNKKCTGKFGTVCIKYEYKCKAP